MMVPMRLFPSLLWFLLLFIYGIAQNEHPIPNIERIRNANVILHIGPPKTGTSHIQSTALRLKYELFRDGWCYPSSEQVDLHQFAVDLREGKDPQNKEFVGRIFSCLREGKKVFISSEKFNQVEVREGYLKIKDFFKGYSVHIVASFRDPLAVTYSWYNQLLRNSARIVTFAEHLTSDKYETYSSRAFAAGLFEYAKLYDVSNMTIIDFQGMMVAKKDFAYVILCEIMGTMCDAHYYPDEGANPSEDLRPSFLFTFVRNIVGSLGCKFNENPTVVFSHVQPRYRSLNFSTLPVLENRMEMVAHLARSIEKKVRLTFATVFAYANPTATEEARSKFLAKEIDEAAFFQHPDWTAWLWAEVKRLQDGGFIIADKCKVSLNLDALSAPTT